MTTHRWSGSLGLALILVVAAAPSCSGGGTAGSQPATVRARACTAPPYPSPPPGRPRYRLRLRIDPTAGRVDGAESVRFTPDLPIDQLVFRLWPNSPDLASKGAHLTPGRVLIDGVATPGRLSDPTTLLVPLGRILGAGEAVTAQLSWRLALPGAVADRISHHGDSVRLGSFFPLLPWEPGVGWATDPPIRGIAETSTSPTADFDMQVTTPPGLVVLASGEPLGGGRWRATAVRDFALAVGRFRIATAIARAPRPVRVTIGVDRGVRYDPRSLALRVAGTLRDLAARYGPYPWSTYSIGFVPNLPAEGIEYPTMVFEGAGGLGLVTSHETAHQWFYSLVGNDQARDPVLDEGLASWAGAEQDGRLGVFSAVPVPPGAHDRLGAPMSYWDRYAGFDFYFAGVYAQSVRALSQIGSPGQVDCALRRYVSAHAYAIATQADLLAALSRVSPRARATLRGYGLDGPGTG